MLVVGPALGRLVLESGAGRATLGVTALPLAALLPALTVTGIVVGMDYLQIRRGRLAWLATGTPVVTAESVRGVAENVREWLNTSRPPGPETDVQVPAPPDTAAPVPPPPEERPVEGRGDAADQPPPP